MELASMLAGEPFGDSPQCVSPVVAAFLRTYNDGVGDERRQDLYEYAARSVGSRARTRAEQDRASECIGWAARLNGALTLRFPVFAGGSTLRGCEAAGAYAARAALRHGDAHSQALAFLDALIGDSPQAAVERSEALAC
jgi:hypothetical protein